MNSATLSIHRTLEIQDQDLHYVLTMVISESTAQEMQDTQGSQKPKLKIHSPSASH